jgi:hypothetical protein
LALNRGELPSRKTSSATGQPIKYIPKYINADFMFSGFASWFYLIIRVAG